MKNIVLKRVLSGFLAIVMAVLLLPFSSIEAKATTSSSPTIAVDSKKAAEGGTAKVNINLENNPGITSMRVNVFYDDTLLTLTDVEYNSNMGGQSVLPENLETAKSPVILYWTDGFNDYASDCVFATLTFSVSDEASSGDYAEISVSYDAEDVYNADEQNVAFEVDAGGVSIIAKVAGDINGDGTLNTKDTTRLMRYFAGWDVEVNESALDVNGDGSYNTKDTTRLMRYLAGWDVEIYIDGVAVKKCNHTMEAVAYKAATCTEDGNVSYYYCTTCEKYFNDSNGTTELSYEQTILKAAGHTAVTDPAVDPTTTEYGWTEGSHCSVCGEVLVAQERIDPIEEDEYYIYYHIGFPDTYILELYDSGLIDNPNPETYTESDNIPLIDLQTINYGYNFDGWYDVNGTRIAQIENMTGTLHLYATLEAKEYEVQFDSPLVPKAAEPFYAKTGLTLDDPDELSGYVFMGWCDENGDLVSQIPVGTAKDITLYGNWTSRRNQTIPADSLGEPVIHLDEENNQILFAYEIGTIENIPLYQLEDSFELLTSGDISRSVTTAVTIDEGMAEAISEAVSNATTKSASMTLSSEWTESSSISEEHLSEMDSSISSNRSAAYSDSGTFNVSTSQGGSRTTTVEGGVSAKIGTKLTAEASAAFPVKGVDVEAKVGTEISSELSAEISASESDTKTWNTNAGYSATRTASQSESLTQTLAEKISNSVSYDVSNAATEGSSNTTSTASSSTDTREYASSFTYGTSTLTESTYEVTLSNAPSGYYRMVAAGRAHVFAVVVYDIASNAYGVFTYSIMEDGVRPFLDYSKESYAFEDEENGVLPFEVPYYVNNYVDSIVGASDGLVVDIDTGIIMSYTGTDEIVIIPQYMPVDSGDGTVVVKITGFDAGVFAGNTSVQAVQLCDNITEIPAGAFEGCTALKLVVGDSVTSIGANAFAGCTALKDYEISTDITSLGDNAFEDVTKLTVNATNAAVADAAIASGAKNIVLNMSVAVSDKTYNIPATTESFTFNGGGLTYTDVVINSDAQTTVINNATFQNSTETPLVISSANVTLNRLTISAPGIALKLTAETANVGLYGTVSISSDSGNAAIGKSVVFSQASSSVVGKLSLDGNFLYSGSVEGQSYASFSSDDYGFIFIDSENPVVLTFDANGGTVSEGSRLVYGGTAVGELPTATRDHYSFQGWFTAAEGGDEITSDTIIAQDTTVYAQWEQSEFSWSEWSTTYPEDVGTDLIESKVQYRSREMEYTTADTSTLSGWTQYDTSQAWSDYSSWSSWQDASVSEDDETDVKTRMVYAYYYYKCPSCGAHMHGYGSSACYTWAGGCGATIPSSGSWNQVWSTVSWDDADLQDWHGTGKYYTYIDGELVFKHTSGGSKTQYSYRTRELVTTYYFSRWGDWSAWGDSKITSSDEVDVETRTVYRYEIYSAEANS